MPNLRNIKKKVYIQYAYSPKNIQTQRYKLVLKYMPILGNIQMLRYKTIYAHSQKCANSTFKIFPFSEIYKHIQNMPILRKM